MPQEHTYDGAWSEEYGDPLVAGTMYRVKCKCGQTFQRLLTNFELVNSHRAVGLKEATKDMLLRQLADHVIAEEWLPLFQDPPPELKVVK